MREAQLALLCKTQITVLERAQSNGGSTLNTLNAHFCPATSKFSLTLSFSFEAPVRPRWVACGSVDMDLQYTECGADEQSYMNKSIVNSNTLNYSTTVCNRFCFSVVISAVLRLFYCFVRMLTILFFNKNLCSLGFINWCLL